MSAPPVPHRIAAGAIVEHEGRLLMVRHVRAGRYDFWVAPGGGVQGEESLQAAAEREVLEESGLRVQVTGLRYIEELCSPEWRQVKFWFGAELLGGTLAATHPAAVAEHITEAAWLTRDELAGRTVFPPVLQQRYWQDRIGAWPAPIHLPLRPMDFW